MMKRFVIHGLLTFAATAIVLGVLDYTVNERINPIIPLGLAFIMVGPSWIRLYPIVKQWDKK